MSVPTTPGGHERMVEALTRKLSGFFDVGSKTAEELLALCSETRTFAAKQPVVSHGLAYGPIYLLKAGWAIRSRLLEDGSRQIVNAAMPGDFLCLNALIFDRSDFDVTAKTDCEVYVIEAGRLRNVFGSDPTLAAAILWVTAHEEAILAERIVSLGRRSARTRTAHVLCEFVSRLEIIGVDNLTEIVIPLTQEDFSDILGISVVHTNKTLRALERDGIITFRNSLLVVRNRTMLERTAGFDNGYLHFTRVMRRKLIEP